MSEALARIEPLPPEPVRLEPDHPLRRPLALITLAAITVGGFFNAACGRQGEGEAGPTSPPAATAENWPTASPSPTVETGRPVDPMLEAVVMANRESLKGDVLEAGRSILRDMRRPGAGMTTEGFDHRTIGTRPDLKQYPGAPDMQASFDPDRRIVRLSSSVDFPGQQLGEHAKGEAKIEIALLTTENHALMLDAGRLTLADFENVFKSSGEQVVLAWVEAGVGTQSVRLIWGENWEARSVKVMDSRGDPGNTRPVESPEEADEYAFTLEGLLSEAAITLQLASMGKA